MDRFSDLPDFIVHHIISFLDTREAYRTCILSKRWAHISATNPIIEFHYYCEPKFPCRCCPSEEVSARLLGYIDSRMQRYAKDNLRVRTLRLRFPNSHKVGGCNVKDLRCIVKELPHVEELPSKIDEWLRIAVRNQVEKLDLGSPVFEYQLPDILLSAKSLRQLNCIQVKIPNYNGAINLESLQTLELLCVDVEERMLNHIISSCLLLKCLSVNNCFGFKTIVIPCCSQLKELTLCNTLPKDGTIILETSSLVCFKFSDLAFDRWPVMSKPGLLRNLTVLDIYYSVAIFVEISLANSLYQSVCDSIKFNEEELGDVNLGPPRNITELKLTLYYLKLSRSSVSAFLNGIFWTCRPDIISFRFYLEDPDLMIQLFMSELEDMANCLRHPLKRIECPDANCSNILESEKVEVQWRLHW
ncbi:F-box protein At4g09920-like [Silene latifolia]|uniref:F-box protein At4g09920-like n=1 Tax=Silene latifolia TaxID=37657 RepID=UPI003D786729